MGRTLVTRDVDVSGTGVAFGAAQPLAFLGDNGTLKMVKARGDAVANNLSSCRILIADHLLTGNPPTNVRFYDSTTVAFTASATEAFHEEHDDGSGGLLPRRYRRSTATPLNINVQSVTIPGAPAAWTVHLTVTAEVDTPNA